MSQQSQEDLEHTLTFEEFITRDQVGQSWIPHYNNFFLHFAGDDIYRDRSYYQRFASEHPEMAASLCHRIQTRPFRGNVLKILSPTIESLKPFEPELYEAYKIMRSYGASHDQLFR